MIGLATQHTLGPDVTLAQRAELIKSLKEISGVRVAYSDREIRVAVETTQDASRDNPANELRGYSPHGFDTLDDAPSGTHGFAEGWLALSACVQIAQLLTPTMLNAMMGDGVTFREVEPKYGEARDLEPARLWIITATGGIERVKPKKKAKAKAAA